MLADNIVNGSPQSYSSSQPQHTPLQPLRMWPNHATYMTQVPQNDMNRRKYLFPPIYPCHYMVQRAGYMGVWIGAHAAILAYFLAAHMASDWTEGLNFATQYGILISLMGILIAMSPTFLGMLHTTPLNRIFTFEKRVHAHKFMSYVLFAWTIAHTSLHYWSSVRYADSINATHLFIFWQDRLGVTGQLMWIFFLLIGLAALPIVRRLCYELFYYVHHLYLVNIALLYVHSENGMAIRYISCPLAIFIIDYVYRTVRSYPLTTSRRARIRYIKFHPCEVVEVGFDRREVLQHTRIGQYVKLCVPELGIFQWHPFTITATPGETKIMADGKPHGIWKIHFKVSGNWTYQLSQRLHRVTAGGDVYANNFDQEARIGRVVDDAVVPEAVALECGDAECDESYLMAIAGRLDPGASAVMGNAEKNGCEQQRIETVGGSDSRNITAETHITMVAVTPEMMQDNCEVASPLDSERTCRAPMAPKKCESDGSSFMSSSANSMYDDFWFVPEVEGEHRQARLPTILVDGPYNAPMETFFEFHANIIVAAGIGITPYISALEHVLDQCANNIPVRTTQTTSEALLPQKIYLVWVFRDISMLCVMLSVLQRLRDNVRGRNIVVPCLYVTGAVDVEHEGAVSDVFGRPMFKLSNGIRISQGRPPIARMMSYMAGKHPNSRMGVFSCASSKLTAEVRTSAHNTNAAVAHQGTSIEMRAECFSM